LPLQALKDFLIGFLMVFAFAFLGTLFLVLLVLLSFYLMGLIESFVIIFVPISCYYFRLICGTVFIFVYLFFFAFVSYLAKEGPFSN